eukprot:Plantae.Rhodophyta-Palmaria_palmata.ctg17479.p3 GENE.Plantae.Rhodophyta-Palmaria_palmata.ctg17479~~Plantae.Rhodophyta-Palmaria_palmata.ctg17479.p3  ORF type:complete len:171 (+),score=7.97 Plantae.Rhodophyta-Palmaria_palmata.ctg17479:350-862(+)
MITVAALGITGMKEDQVVVTGAAENTTRMMTRIAAPTIVTDVIIGTLMTIIEATVEMMTTIEEEVAVETAKEVSRVMHHPTVEDGKVMIGRLRAGRGKKITTTLIDQGNAAVVEVETRVDEKNRKGETGAEVVVAAAQEASISKQKNNTYHTRLHLAREVWTAIKWRYDT